MARRNTREDNTVSDTDNDFAAEAASTETEATKRARRDPIDTGNVTVQVLEDDAEVNFGGRSSKLDTDPVALAVRDSVDGKVNVLNVEADKVEGVLSIARRAGARYGKGLKFDTRRRAEGVILFKTGPKRKTKAKAEGTDTAE